MLEKKRTWLCQIHTGKLWEKSDEAREQDFQSILANRQVYMVGLAC